MAIFEHRTIPDPLKSEIPVPQYYAFSYPSKQTKFCNWVNESVESVKSLGELEATVMEYKLDEIRRYLVVNDIVFGT